MCFSEAPFRYLGWAIAEGYRAERPYHPFGILVEKDWLFARGAGPASPSPTFLLTGRYSLARALHCHSPIIVSRLTGCPSSRACSKIWPR